MAIPNFFRSESWNRMRKNVIRAKIHQSRIAIFNSHSLKQIFRIRNDSARIEVFHLFFTKKSEIRKESDQSGTKLSLVNHRHKQTHGI